MNLINKFGTGSSSILHQNFVALLAEIPVIDGIDMDDEDNYNRNTSSRPRPMCEVFCHTAIDK